MNDCNIVPSFFLDYILSRESAYLKAKFSVKLCFRRWLSYLYCATLKSVACFNANNYSCLLAGIIILWFILFPIIDGFSSAFPSSIGYKGDLSKRDLETDLTVENLIRYGWGDRSFTLLLLLFYLYDSL